MARFSGRSLIVQSAWALTGQLAQAVLALASVAVIARLLGPDVYGVFALTMLVLGLAEILIGGHATDFLIQKETVGPGDSNAAFVLTLFVAGAAAVVVSLSAPIVAAAIGAPEAAGLMPAIGGLIILTALGNVPTHLLTRGMKFKVLARIDTAAALAAFVVGTALAYGGAGIWSLFGMEFARRGLRVALVVAAARWRPGVSFDRRNVVELWRFARPRLLGASFQYVALATPRLVIAAMVGTQALGYFALAARVLDQATGLMTGPLAAVAFPAAARAKGDLNQLRTLLGQAIATSTAAVWPAILGFVVIAPIIIPLLLGPRWVDGVLTFQILTLTALRASVTGFNGAILLGLGRADLRMRLHFFNAILNLGLCPIGALFGLEGVATAMVVRAFISWPISASYVERLTGFAAKRQIRIAFASAVPAIGMAISVEILRKSVGGLIPAQGLVAVLIASGIVLYIAFWALFNHRQAATLTRQTFDALSRRSEGWGGRQA